MWKNCGRSGTGVGGGGRCAGACCCTQGLGLGGGCGSHCPGGLSPGGDAVGLLAAGCDAAGLLPTGWCCGVCAYGPMPIFVGGGGEDHADHDHEPFGGVRGSWAAHDLHLQVATELLAAAALQKLTQLLHAGRARAPPGLARAMPSGPQKNWKTYDDIANQSQQKVIRGSLALPDNKRGSGQALLLKGYTQLPECVYAQCYRLKLQIHAAEFLTNVQGNTSSGNPWDLYISRSC